MTNSAVGPETRVSAYTTSGGVRVERLVSRMAPSEVRGLAKLLDERMGVFLSSNYEYPGRYTRWDIGFVDPPLILVGKGRSLKVSALNSRGAMLVNVIAARCKEGRWQMRAGDGEVEFWVDTPDAVFSEEDRTRQPSLFAVLRRIIALFASPEEPHLGLFGAFGYDLAHALEPFPLRLVRQEEQRDLVLFLPDEIYVVDNETGESSRSQYEFELNGQSSRGLARTGSRVAFVTTSEEPERTCDHAPGEYQALVDVAREAFRQGDLFEVVPGQSFFRRMVNTPATVFATLQQINPSPYGFLLNLGEGEYLIGASPEMFVRVDGRRVETCPISGTIARGEDAIEDAAQIRCLLNSEKDECELTMCTDVDRNDKARVCEPGSVRVRGRRQIETYSRLFHTVDHVEGQLREDRDAVDAFMTHMWAVTVTGAPKRAAMEFLEKHEKTPRAFYGGAVGTFGFDGHLNSGLTIRTIHVKRGQAGVRAGATLLFDSDREAEERETRTKAHALLEALEGGRKPARACATISQSGKGKRVLLVDHLDSFVHTLGDYFRQSGAEVFTMRPGLSCELLEKLHPQLLVLSPGPGRPQDFQVSQTLELAIGLDIPVFGVCLGLQGIVEHFGGALGILDVPMHGKPSKIEKLAGALFQGIEPGFQAGRYHSLFALPRELPAELMVTAQTPDGVIMAVEHRKLPIAAVQFHPESIMSLSHGAGQAIISNVMKNIAKVGAA